MFIQNKWGEFVNLNNVAAIKTSTNARDCNGEIRHYIYMYTQQGKKIIFNYKTIDEFANNYKTIQELLIKGPKPSQKPLVDENVKWVCANGAMLHIDQIECIMFAGGAVTVHMSNSEIKFYYNNNDERLKCLNAFEFNLRSAGHLIELDGWKTEG